MSGSVLKSLTALLAAVAVASCAPPNPQKASVLSQPGTPVVKNITSFSNSLRCMDNLFAEYGKREIIVTSDGIPDKTGQVLAGTKDMLITTLSKMSQRSRAFLFTDIETINPETGVTNAVAFVQDRIGAGFDLPPFYIRGAITQLDRNIADDSSSVGLAVPFASIGYGEDQILSTITLDLNMGDTVKRQIIPGLHTTNTITIVSSGSGGDVEGVIQKASLFFEVSQNRNQGTHQSLRTVLELSLIEMLGKFTKVPYWRCLEIQSTDPGVIQQARDWYDQMPNDERVNTIQRGMQGVGAYSGPINGRMTNSFREAVNRYKASNDLIANGRIDFDLYYALLTRNAKIAPDAYKPSSAAQTLTGDGQRALQTDKGKPRNAAYDPNDTSNPDTRGSYVGLKMAVRGGARKTRPVGSNVVFDLTTKRDAHVYCYYQFVDNNTYQVVRIFPNQWQPNALVKAGSKVQVPSASAPFDITPSTPGQEGVISCIGKEGGYSAGTEPAALREAELSPLRSASFANAVVDQHLAVDQANTGIDTIRWTAR